MNYYVTRSLSLISCCFYILSPGLSAQDDSETADDKKELRRVAIMPIGDLALGGMKTVNGKPVPVDPKPSEMIPDTVFVKKGRDYLPLNLRMNTPSQSWNLLSKSSFSILKQKNGNYVSFAKIALPEGKEDLTVFMLRNRKTKSWTSAPHSLIFKNGIESFPLGGTRIINFSRYPVMAIIGGQKYQIGPRNFKVIKGAASNGKNQFLSFQFTSKINGHVVPIAHSAISFDQKSRSNFIIYERDGNGEIKMEGDDAPLKFVNYFELPHKAPADTAEGQTTPAAVTTP